ncbi:MAG TPA: UDP-N-acetylglucosamine 2-epimerase (non-hydrolyzing) [Acidimicrobiales bacterium]|nr:UDP-N-acetylglucosamine 2-epimerase (non-hydrolyzing) [Acidimicrobiales bacterium]
MSSGLVGESRRSVAVVLGTRPEIIKLARIIQLLGDRATVVHTGQHYDASLSSSFFEEHGLADPDVQLGVGGLRRGGQVGQALADLDGLFDRHRPDVVIVQGDTNATLAGALAANSASIPLFHVEAGLRSYDSAMPEEHNRVLTDHVSDVLCAATKLNADNLALEGLADRAVITGNTVVEAVARQLPAAPDRRGVLERYGCDDAGYVLATIHRPENTDDPEKLGDILRALGACGRQVLLPLHPRTRGAIERHGLQPLTDGLHVVDPLGSRAFLALANHAALLVSDSGGVQEECTVLKRPLVVVRNSTERPESLERFARLVQPDALLGAITEVLEAGPEHLAELADLPSPYGDGFASERIVAHVLRIADDDREVEA